MKKLMMTALIAALMLAPLNTIAVEQGEPSAPPVQAEVSLPQEAFLPGEVPAQQLPTDAITPALHGVLLAMMNQGVSSFDPADRELVWESLYNMLSLYGQLDERSEYQGEDLLVMSETVYDYAAALIPDLSALGQLPKSLADRMTYVPEHDSYLVVCGSDSLSTVQAEVVPSAGSYAVTGQLVYEVDGSVLASFTARMVPLDSMFGLALDSFILT